MKLSELLEDRGRLTNRMAVPILLSTDAAQRLATARGAVDRAERAVRSHERRVESAAEAEGDRMQKPRTTRARADLEVAQAELVAAEEELSAAQDAAAEHLVDFVVESVGSDAWEQLVLGHQPTDEQRKRLREQTGQAPEFNPETFPLAAVAACLREPEVDGLDDVKQLKASVPDIVWQQIFGAVLRANRGANRVDPSWLGSGRTTSSEPGSEQL